MTEAAMVLTASLAVGGLTAFLICWVIVWGRR